MFTFVCHVVFAFGLLLFTFTFALISGLKLCLHVRANGHVHVNVNAHVHVNVHVDVHVNLCVHLRRRVCCRLVFI